MKNLKDIQIDIAQSKLPCYVYLLFKQNGIPFYVGKGKSNRISCHEAEARYFKNGKIWKGINKLKLNTINEILESGEQIYYEIDSWHDMSMMAGEREIYLVKSIGRLVLNTGPLTNIRDGGDLMTEQDRKIFGERIRQFYIDHPEARERLSEKIRQHYIDHPETREKISSSLKTFCEDNPEFIESLQREKNRWIDENNEEYIEAEKKRIAICRSESHRKKISEINKEYFANNPEELERLKNQGKNYWVGNEDAVEQARQNSINNNSSGYIKKWLEDESEEVLLQKEEKYKKHAEWLTGWHDTEEGKKKTKEAAKKRNEKFRTEEHRKHMSEKTKDFIKKNKESDDKRRQKVVETKKITIETKIKCYDILEKYLEENGKFEVNRDCKMKTRMTKLKKAGLVPDFFPLHGGLPVWEKCLENVLEFTIRDQVKKNEN